MAVMVVDNIKVWAVNDQLAAQGSLVCPDNKLLVRSADGVWQALCCVIWYNKQMR